MAVSLPYLVSYKNVPTLFEKIASAKIPDNFSHSFLQTTIGLKSTGDRALIPLLRNFGFIDQTGKPTETYRLLKGEKRKAAVASGIRKAYGPLFDAEEKANTLSGERLKSLVSQVAGTDDDLTSRIANTFQALVRVADFESSQEVPAEQQQDRKDSDPPEDASREQVRTAGFRPEFHYDIHIHLPSNGTEETYLNIFNALRKTFQ